MLWWIPLVAGVQDGVGPCLLLSLAVLLFVRAWCEARAIPVRGVTICFIAAFFCFSLLFNIGLLANLLWFKPVIAALKVGNLCAGALSLLAGVVFLYEWVKLKKQDGKSSGAYQRLLNLGGSGMRRGVVVYLMAGLAALFMSILSTVWPPHYYISMISNNVFLPGKLWESVVLLAAYGICQLWLMTLLVKLFSAKDLTRDFKLIISAAIFLSAGVVIFYVL